MATVKQEPSPMQRLDQHVDRRDKLMKRGFLLEEQLPKLRQAWTEAAATADPSDDLPAQRAYEAAERELKNVQAALVGLDQKIESTKLEIGHVQREAMRVQARKEGEGMEAEAEAMEDNFTAFIDHATRFIKHHNACRHLIGTPDQLVALARWVEVQLIAAGFPDLNYQRQLAYIHGPGTPPMQAAENTVAITR